MASFTGTTGLFVDLIYNRPNQTVTGTVYIPPKNFDEGDARDLIRASQQSYITTTDPFFKKWEEHFVSITGYDMYNHNRIALQIPSTVSAAISSWEPHHIVLNKFFLPGGIPIEHQPIAHRLTIRILEVQTDPGEAEHDDDNDDDDDIDNESIGSLRSFIVDDENEDQDTSTENDENEEIWDSEISDTDVSDTMSCCDSE